MIIMNRRLVKKARGEDEKGKFRKLGAMHIRNYHRLWRMRQYYHRYELSSILYTHSILVAL